MLFFSKKLPNKLIQDLEVPGNYPNHFITNILVALKSDIIDLAKEYSIELPKTNNMGFCDLPSTHPEKFILAAYSLANFSIQSLSIIGDSSHSSSTRLMLKFASSAPSMLKAYNYFDQLLNEMKKNKDILMQPVYRKLADIVLKHLKVIMVIEIMG